MTTQMEQLASDLGNHLKKQNWKLALAESCTAGGIAYYVTSISGSSDWFDRGFVTYSNTSKEEMLGVTSITLNVFGSVSEQIAREMAEGTLTRSQAHVALSITGIAGPSGGTRDKPVGTVWIACSSHHRETQSFVDIFSGTRQEIREQFITMALQKLINYITSASS